MFRLREVRKSKGITQQELATFLNITQATLSGWETEKFEIDNLSLVKCADYFNISIDYLFGRTDIPEVNLGESSHQLTTLDRVASEFKDSEKLDEFIDNLAKRRKNIDSALDALTQLKPITGTKIETTQQAKTIAGLKHKH